MMTFAIENETNSITLYATDEEAQAITNAEHFRNEAGFARLAANWPTARLVEIWNSLPGAAQVRKFTDRKTAVTRIWKAIQSMAGSVPAETAPEESEQVSAETGAQPAPEPGAEPMADVTAQSPEVPTPDINVVRPTPEVAPELPIPDGKPRRGNKVTRREGKKIREGSKTEAILSLMKQPGGTTLKAIMETTSWQAHSVRGFISGTLGKKMRLEVVSAKARTATAATRFRPEHASADTFRPPSSCSAAISAGPAASVPPTSRKAPDRGPADPGSRCEAETR